MTKRDAFNVVALSALSAWWSELVDWHAYDMLWFLIALAAVQLLDVLMDAAIRLVLVSLRRVRAN